MWQRESKACVSQACSTTNLWALGVECRKSSGCWSRPCEVQRRHVLRWNLPTPRFASAPPDVWICGGWGLLSCEWPDLLVPGGFVYQVRRRGLDTQPWVAPPECIRFFFLCNKCGPFLAALLEGKREVETCWEPNFHFKAAWVGCSVGSLFLRLAPQVWYTSV